MLAMGGFVFVMGAATHRSPGCMQIQSSRCTSKKRTFVCRVGQNHIYTVCTRYFLAGKSHNIRSYTVYMYISGQSLYVCNGCVLRWRGNSRSEQQVRV